MKTDYDVAKEFERLKKVALDLGLSISLDNDESNFFLKVGGLVLCQSWSLVPIRAFLSGWGRHKEFFGGNKCGEKPFDKDAGEGAERFVVGETYAFTGPSKTELFEVVGRPGKRIEIQYVGDKANSYIMNVFVDDGVEVCAINGMTAHSAPFNICSGKTIKKFVIGETYALKDNSDNLIYELEVIDRSDSAITFRCDGTSGKTYRKNVFIHDGVETCAANGMTAKAEPVGIDADSTIKKFVIGGTYSFQDGMNDRLTNLCDVIFRTDVDINFSCHGGSSFIKKLYVVDGVETCYMHGDNESGVPIKADSKI